MVMHSNERGECCLRTLVDRKRKRYDNVVDVVVRLHDRPILSTERTTPPRLVHVQLGDVPRTHDPVELREEFRQHDGMVTMLMKLPTQGFASAPLRYDRGGLWWRGAPHTAKRSMINCCVYGVPPCPRIYRSKGGGGRP